MTAILILYLIITLTTLTNYSDAWDNVSMFQYGRDSANIFRHPFQHYFQQDYGPVDLRYFGPFLVTIAYLIDQTIEGLLPFWTSLDIFRLCYFLTYLTGVWFFYLLCKRFFSGWVSFSATLILITQPLFFGQAPTSPKDTTFLGMTIIAVYLGLRMIDGIPKEEQPILPRKSAVPLAILGASFGSFLLTYQKLIGWILHWAAESNPEGTIGQLFRSAAPGYPDIPLAQYISKLSTIALRAGVGLFALVVLIVLGPIFFRRLWLGLRGRYVIAAGILYGLSISVRILGLLIGGVVLFILLSTGKIKDWFYSIAAYTLTASITIFLTWPYLWPKPICRFLESLQVNLGHQHNPTVMFNGISYPSTELPWNYVPTLIGIQFTLPLILLALLGLGLTMINWQKSNKHFKILILIWFFLPLGLFIILRPAMHDNIRHSLFIMPPLFLLGGAALEKLRQLVNGKSLVFAVLNILSLLPGIIHIINHHPYEYIYYNQLAGGTARGTTSYEADYLALSLSEGIEFINQQAEPNATIYVLGPENIARSIIREDLKLVSRNNFPDNPLDAPNTYLVTYGRLSEVDALTPIFQVKKGNVILGGVYQHPDSKEDGPSN